MQTSEPIIAYGNQLLDFQTGSPYIGTYDEFQGLPTKRKTFIVETLEDDFSKYFPKEEDPYTQTDLLNNEENQVQELIYQIRKSLPTRYRESLANRILTLFNDAKEEDSASLGIAVGSLRNFYNFFRLNTNLKCPTISLTPDYNIYASWRGEQNQIFSVHFLPNRDARFVIFKPNDKHPELKIRLSGTATTDILIKTVESIGIWDWISE
ncbi:MAG: hypothetical protein SVZ03_02015 [Spirochaetota bacterium]|nr:hypothetical protein [Spirochaetota bacterium]